MVGLWKLLYAAVVRIRTAPECAHLQRRTCDLQVVAQPLCIRLILMQLEARTWELWQLVVTYAPFAHLPSYRTIIRAHLDDQFFGR